MDDRQVEANGIWEKLWLALWLALIGVTPVWALLAATLAQVHPALRDVLVQDVDGSFTLLPMPMTARLLGGAGIAALWLVALAAVVVPMALLVMTAAKMARGRQPAVISLDDALVQDASWQVNVQRGDQAKVVRPVSVPPMEGTVLPPPPVSPAPDPDPAEAAPMPDATDADGIDDLFER